MQGKQVEEIIDLEQPASPFAASGEPRSSATVAAFLCSERASYVCGVNLLVDGGIGPRHLNRFFPRKCGTNVPFDGLIGRIVVIRPGKLPFRSNQALTRRSGYA